MRLTLGLVLALGLAGAAQAQPDGNFRNRDGVTTRAEVQARAGRMFERLNANRDGRIDAADRAVRQASRMEARFDRLDADDNGSISRAEFTQRAALRRDGDRAGMGERRMRRPGMARHGMRRGMMAGRMADGDRDGSITQAEFMTATLQRFERMDANRDGQVTRDERQSARQQMRGRVGRGMAAPSPAD